MAKAVMDTLQFHYDSSVFPINSNYWDASVSWANKYSDVENLVRKKWLGIPVPTLLTDGWHLFQSIFLSLVFVAIIIYKPITDYILIDFIILRLVFGIGFILFYNKILRK